MKVSAIQQPNKALVGLKNSHGSTHNMVYVPHSCSSVPCLSFLSSFQLQLQQQHTRNSEITLIHNKLMDTLPNMQLKSLVAPGIVSGQLGFCL